MSERCATCKHWDSDAKGAVHQGGIEGRAGDWGECQSVGFYIYAPDDSVAIVSDAEGYTAVLSTKSDFGCVLHEPRDAP